MASYSLALRATAVKELSWLDAGDVRRVMDALLLLAVEPRPLSAVRLAEGERYRLRSAGYRMTYTIDEPRARIVVAGVASRSAAYRGHEDPAAYFL